MMDVLYKHISEPPKPPRELDPSLPLGLNNAILVALAKEPAKRFQSMEGFGNALRSLQTSSAPASAPSHTSQELPSQPRPQTTLGARGEVIAPEPRTTPPRGIIFGAVAATVLGAATVFALWGGGSAPDAPSAAAPPHAAPKEPPAPAPAQTPEPAPAPAQATSAPVQEAAPEVAPGAQKQNKITPKITPKAEAPKNETPKAEAPKTDGSKLPKEPKPKKTPPKKLTKGNPEL
jgi:serine/threonine-protein kinase